MTIFVVMIEDRHADVEIHLISDFKVALEYASEVAHDSCRSGRHYDPDYFEEEYRSPPTIMDNWGKCHYYARYSTEGDSVKVLEVELDGGINL